MFGFLKKSLSNKITVAIVTTIVLIMGAEIIVRIYFGTRDRIELMTIAARELASSTYAGIKYPMSIGDSEAVKRELLDVRGKTTDVEVFISDFNQEIIYSTHGDKVKTRVADSIHNKATLQTLTETLKTGVEPQKSFEDVVAGRRYLTVIEPILNQKDCYHCHGSSRKVLGSMIVRVSAEQVYKTVAAQRNRTIVVTTFGLSLVITLIYLMANKLVRRPVERLADKAKRFAAGDMSVSVDVKTEDEVGVLGNSFNYMVKSIKDQIEYANSIKDAICDPLFMVDRDMVVTYMNEACVQLTGYSKTEVEGNMICREIFKSDICETNCPVRYCYESGEPIEGIRVNIINREGKQIPIMTSASPLRDAHGVLIGAVEICKDITDVIEWGTTLEKKVEEKTEEIKRAQAQLLHSAKLASLGRMAAGIAHEINNPLTGIVTFGHLLLNKFPEGSKDRENIEVIIEHATRCLSIIKGLFSFARATTVGKGIVNINDELKNSLNVVWHREDFFNIKLNMDLDESLTPVKADSSHIQQVFLNIIINAADAMDGKGTLTVCTRKVIEDGEPFAEVEFTDTGHGISEENMAKLFEPFFTTKPFGKGTGLGLAVSHGIIQDHGGKIFAKSKVGEGTSFFVRLPLYEG